MTYPVPLSSRKHLAIIGSGPSSIYLLKHLLDESGLLLHHVGQISIFERQAVAGMGMPYNPQMTDRFNMANICSEELPALPVSFGDWLRAQPLQVLRRLGLEHVQIRDTDVYGRLALGSYFHAQYQTLLARLQAAGVRVHEHAGCEIVDVRDQHPTDGKVTLVTAAGAEHTFDRLIIATGHQWPRGDQPDAGFYASPWPMAKLLPAEDEPYDFVIGTLGASLSAFDVIGSLAHRQGRFVRESGRLVFHPHPGAPQFKMVMHSAHGLLPHLQFDQVEPYREIYRHVSREDLLALIDPANDYLRLDVYFDAVCRPALAKAFAQDGMADMVKRLGASEFGLLEFIEIMTDKHDYADAFEGMRREMREARESVLQHKPIHWKEVLDDLMYTLNFHAELLPAEDHLTLKSRVMPFLLNVVAAMPLVSGDTILALHAAGRLEMVAGKVTHTEPDAERGLTTVTVEQEGGEVRLQYRLFVDCSGQKALELEDYPFPSLVAEGAARRARAAFATPELTASSLPEEVQPHLFYNNGKLYYHTGGIDIDAAYRLIGSDGSASARIHDLAFPHTSGIRPYSYGLQACSDTCAILVKSWAAEADSAAPVGTDFATLSEVYAEVQSTAA